MAESQLPAYAGFSGTLHTSSDDVWIGVEYESAHGGYHVVRIGPLTWFPSVDQMGQLSDRLSQMLSALQSKPQPASENVTPEPAQPIVDAAAEMEEWF